MAILLLFFVPPLILESLIASVTSRPLCYSIFLFAHGSLEAFSLCLDIFKADLIWERSQIPFVRWSGLRLGHFFCSIISVEFSTFLVLTIIKNLGSRFFELCYLQRKNWKEDCLLSKISMRNMLSPIFLLLINFYANFVQCRYLNYGNDGCSVVVR